MEAAPEGLSWKECEWTVSSTSQMSEKAMAKGRSRYLGEEKTDGPHMDRWIEALSNEPKGVQLTPELVNSGHPLRVDSGIPLYCQKQHN